MTTRLPSVHAFAGAMSAWIEWGLRNCHRTRRRATRLPAMLSWMECNAMRSTYYQCRARDDMMMIECGSQKDECSGHRSMQVYAPAAGAVRIATAIPVGGGCRVDCTLAPLHTAGKCDEGGIASRIHPLLNTHGFGSYNHKNTSIHTHTLKLLKYTPTMNSIPFQWIVRVCAWCAAMYWYIIHTTTIVLYHFHK